MLRILILVFALTWNIGALSKEQPPDKSIQAHQKTDSDKRGTSGSPLIVQVLPSTDADKIAKGQQKNDGLIAYATVALAFITLFLAFFTARLWGSTKKLVESADRTAERQLRAYVGVEDIFFVALNPQLPPESRDLSKDILKLRIKNYGQTPAEEMAFYFDYAVPRPKNGIEGFAGPLEGKQMLHPNMAVDFSPVSPTHKVDFWFWGHITYRDIYNRWWRTNYCFAYRAIGNYFAPVGGHNNEAGPYKTEGLTETYIPTKIEPVSEPVLDGGVE